MTTEPAPARRRGVIGAVGLPISGGRLHLGPNQRLNGPEAIRVYRQMRVDEPACAAFTNAALSLLRTDLSVQPGGPSRGDAEAAAWLEVGLGQMRQGMATILRQMYSLVYLGWSIHELQYRRDDAGRVAWADIGLRRQETLHRWVYDDADGGQIVGFEQRPPPRYDLAAIPLSQAVHIVSDDADASPEGLSVYRGIYRPWRITANLEMLMGIALERFGTGVPVFEIGAGVQLSDADEETLQDAITALRQNEEAGVITPEGVSFRFAESPGLRASDYLETIRYLRVVMLAAMGADFIALGTQAAGGAYALGQDKSELFLLALNTVQDRVVEALNRQAVRQLFRYPANRFPGMTAPPVLSLPAVKRYDLAALGSLIALLDRVGGLTLSPADEAWIRRISDLMDKDEATIVAERKEAAATTPELETPAPAPEAAADAARPDDDPADDADAEEEPAS